MPSAPSTSTDPTRRGGLAEARSRGSPSRHWGLASARPPHQPSGARGLRLLLTLGDRLLELDGVGSLRRASSGGRAPCPTSRSAVPGTCARNPGYPSRGDGSTAADSTRESEGGERANGEIGPVFSRRPPDELIRLEPASGWATYVKIPLRKRNGAASATPFVVRVNRSLRQTREERGDLGRTADDEPACRREDLRRQLAVVERIRER